MKKTDSGALCPYRRNFCRLFYNTVTTVLSRRGIIKRQNCIRSQRIGKDEEVEHVPPQALVWKDTEDTHSLIVLLCKRYEQFTSRLKIRVLGLVITVFVTSAVPYQLHMY